MAFFDLNDERFDLAVQDTLAPLGKYIQKKQPDSYIVISMGTITRTFWPSFRQCVLKKGSRL